MLIDLRTGSNIQYSLTALLRQSIYSRLAGYDDTNDADRLSIDPIMRQVVGNRGVKRRIDHPDRPLRDRSAHAAAELVGADGFAPQAG